MNGITVVTGCSSGLGRATCTLLLDLGYDVIGLDQNPNCGIDHPNFSLVHCDLIDKNLELILSAALVGRGLYAIVHCAGVSIGGKIGDLTDNDWDLSLETNLGSAMRLCRLAATQMLDGGRIVLIGSPVAFAGANKPSYAASKAGLHGLTMSVSRDLGKRNILVNTILPGPMMTGMTEDWSQEKIDRISKETRLNRLCEPMEVANVINFLLSKQSSFMTASIVDMTAGSLFGH